MALDNTTVQEILQKLDHDRDTYLNTLTRVHEVLTQALTQTQPTLPQATPSTLPLSPTLPPSLRSRRTATGSGFQLESFKKGSLYTADDSSESDDDESFFVQETLPPESYEEEELRTHLKSYTWDKYGQFVLADLLEDPEHLHQADLIQDKIVLDLQDASHTSDVYEVSADGAALHAIKADSGDGFKSIWEGLRRINGDEARRQAVGRICVLREPSPLLIGAMHLTMNEHFDMDNILRLLIDHSPTKGYMKGCLKEDPRHRKSFVFCFKYHTIVGENRSPMSWQRFDEDLSLRDDHIPISTCSSVVALSLAGTATQILRRKSRRKKHIVGQIHDPFAPWRVLSIQCFPDWQSSVEVHDTNHHYVNGPEAFMVTLLAEYRDAYKRFMELNKRIVRMVTPSKDFLFDRTLRDNLLFENDSYTYSRRYFWAFQALALLNDEIEAMITQYKDTFTEDVWLGDHKYIWPGNKDKSARFSNWRKKMAGLRKQFEAEIKQLQAVLRANQQEQKDIKSLRDQLFSGTSVLESREAVHQARITVEQGDNIKLLTLVSIFFLPLTFVTSVFGMTNMNTDRSFVPFGIVTAAVCIPTYFLIGTVNAPDRLKATVKSLFAFFKPLFRLLRKDESQHSNHNSSMAQQTPNNRRRMSRSLTVLETIPTVTRTGYQHKPLNRRVNTESILSPRAETQPQDSSIKFQLPVYGKPSQTQKRPSRNLFLLEKSMSDPGPLPISSEARQQQMPVARRSFLRSFSDRLKGHESPKSPV